MLKYISLILFELGNDIATRLNVIYTSITAGGWFFDRVENHLSLGKKSLNICEVVVAWAGR